MSETDPSRPLQPASLDPTAAGVLAAQPRRRRSHGARILVSRYDWAYLLSLLIPFAAYDLSLRGRLVFAGPDELSFADAARLMQSPLLFLLGYTGLWIGVFAAARGRLRWPARGVFQALTIVIALFMMGAYQYYRATGSLLDSHYLRFWLSFPDGTAGAIASELSLGMRALILVILVYGVLGPPLLARLAGQRSERGDDAVPRHAFRPRWRRVLGVELLALALFSLALLPSGAAGVSLAFARHGVVNLLVTAAEIARGDDFLSTSVAGGVRRGFGARLIPVPSTERRNVVLIFLESTRASATTPYNPELRTTPFMAELAQHSLLVENAYAMIAHTHNALTGSNCGTEPPLNPLGTVELRHQWAVPAPCLPHLLKEQGYNTAFFMSHTKAYEDSESILHNLGYDDFYSLENMDTRAFEETYYWGYEDEVMLEPSRAWLQQHRNKPFLISYLTSAPHHDYRAPSKRNGRVEFAENDQFNRYLNAVRNQDFFLRTLFEQFKQLGLYENSVFVVLGDHGEGFGEHGRYGHDSVIYEEGMRIPLLIHDPRRFPSGARVQGPANQLDLLPTIVELLGFRIQGGAYAGSSLLKPLPGERTIRFSCWAEQECLASLEGTEKYIYYFDDRPEQFFDLASDPGERRNLAGKRPAQELERRRSELLVWRAQVRALYEPR